MKIDLVKIAKWFGIIIGLCASTGTLLSLLAYCLLNFTEDGRAIMETVTFAKTVQETTIPDAEKAHEGFLLRLQTLEDKHSKSRSIGKRVDKQTNRLKYRDEHGDEYQLVKDLDYSTDQFTVYFYHNKLDQKKYVY